MEGEEAAAIFKEVAEETEVLTTETIEALDIVTDASTITEDSIDISDILSDSFETVDLNSTIELITSDSTVLDSINTDVSSTVDTITGELESSGIETSELSGEVGSTFSRTTASSEAGADAVKGGKGAWYYIKKTGGILMKIALVYMVVDFVGKTIVSIVSAIKDATKNPPWKGSLTEDQKTQLGKIQDALSVLSSLIKEWETAAKPLENNPYMSYGTMTVTVGGRQKTVQVIDVLSYLLDDAQQQQKDSHDILKNGIDSLTVIDMTQLENNTYTSFADIQAMIDLRNNKGNLVTKNMLSRYDFPPAKEDVKVSMVLTNDFPNWENNVKNQGFSLAKMGASKAIGAFTKSQVIVKVNEYLRDHVYPVIKRAAKDAGVSAAKSYVKGQKSTIIEKAMIPIFGPELARSYGKEIKEKAIEKAKAAAQAAGRRKAKAMQSNIEAALKPVVQNFIDTNKDTMKQIGKYAAQQILNTVIPPGAKTIEMVSLPAGVKHEDIGHVNPAQISQQRAM